jgi:hypothetical protein
VRPRQSNSWSHRRRHFPPSSLFLPMRRYHVQIFRPGLPNCDIDMRLTWDAGSSVSSSAGAAVSSKRSSRVSTIFYEMKKNSRNNGPRSTPLLCGPPVRFRPKADNGHEVLMLRKPGSSISKYPPNQQAYFGIVRRRDLASRCRGGGV